MTVAIIGTGRIGALTGELFAGFGAKVVGYDLYPNDSLDFLEYKDSIEDSPVKAPIRPVPIIATVIFFTGLDIIGASQVKL